MKGNRLLGSILLGLTVILGQSCKDSVQTPQLGESPRIVNIINFVRQTEPRPVNISDEDLFQTTAAQLELLKKYNLRGTFLLQYDALINPRYQELMREAIAAGCEVGGWWEITQPHVEAAGMTWRGAYPWDWHANVGFSSGYTTQEREALVDTYMGKFKEIFGSYPTAVGSWFIDAHTLQYMADHYPVIASCNCRDQVGTDGYTLWGGYWNQAYYPSKLNAYMPAQTEEGQIDIPIFRMLGSDPINQYDSRIGSPVQGVETLEPVYVEVGGNPVWIDWFFDMLTSGPCLAFQYTQVGQENSFTWPAMKQGLEYQIPLVDSLAKAGKINVLTLSEAGKWFKENYPLTPATSVVALEDVKPAGRKSVWFDSRFYRANLVWEDSTLRFRDIHLFDERLESSYVKYQGTSTQCLYTTLPVVDGFNWSSATQIAGLRLVKQEGDSLESVLVGTPQVEQTAPGELTAITPILEGGNCRIAFNEDSIRICLEDLAAEAEKYCFVLSASEEKNVKLPFTTVDETSVRARVKKVDYRIDCLAGKASQKDLSWDQLITFVPDSTGCLILGMSRR